MKVAISSTGPKLDAPLDQRFGRCPYFIVVDLPSEKFEVLDNQGAMMSGGAGIQAAQMVAKSGAGVVITGNLGPKAADTLAAAGVRTYLGASGTVRQAMEHYKAGQLQESSGPTVESHFSTGGGMGRGKGGGQSMGRGMGGGSGRGSSSDRGKSMARGQGGGRDKGQKRGRRQ